jgi:hypothetical protein
MLMFRLEIFFNEMMEKIDEAKIVIDAKRLK